MKLAGSPMLLEWCLLSSKASTIVRLLATTIKT